MEVQSGVQQLEPRPLGSPRSGANQQNEFDDIRTDDAGGPSADNHSKDVQPARETDDKKVSRCSCCVCMPGCVWMCDDWWNPAWLLSFWWYALYFYKKSFLIQSFFLLKSNVAMHFAYFTLLSGVLAIGNCREVWLIQHWKNMFAQQCCKYVLLVCAFSRFRK